MKCGKKRHLSKKENKNENKNKIEFVVIRKTHELQKYCS